MSRELRARAALVVAAFLYACSEAGLETDRATVRDSSGIEIVETAAPAWERGAGWRLTDSPLLTIGQEEGDTAYLFSRVAGALRLDDGRIVVADGGSFQLRYYDVGGRFVKAVGREGDGPGEFDYIRALKRCGEYELNVFHLNWQTSVFTGEGEFIRKTTLLDPSSGRSPYALACSRDGRFVITGWGPLVPKVGFYRASAPISVLDSSGTLLVDLGEYPSSERIGNEHGSRPHPFGRSTSVEIGRDVVYVGTSEALEVRKFALTGREVDPDRGAARAVQRFTIIRGPVPDLRITSEHMDRYRAAQLERASVEQRPALERDLRDMPLPPGFPAYTELKLDADGNLWLRRFVLPGDTAPYWTVFDGDGVVLGDVSVPPGLTITEIGRDYVLGIHQDELGVERVQLYGLQKGRNRT